MAGSHSSLGEAVAGGVEVVGVLQTLRGNRSEGGDAFAAAGAINWVSGNTASAERDFAASAVLHAPEIAMGCCELFLCIYYWMSTPRLPDDYIDERFSNMLQPLTHERYAGLREHLGMLQKALKRNQQETAIQDDAELTGRAVWEIINATERFLIKIHTPNQDIEAAIREYDKNVNPICETNRLIKGLINGIKYAVICALVMGAIGFCIGVFATAGVAGAGLSDFIFGAVLFGKGGAYVGGLMGFTRGFFSVRPTITSTAPIVADAREIRRSMAELK
jgi:hypothetical protein